VRTAAEEVYVHLQSITDVIEDLSSEVRAEHEQILVNAQNARHAEAKKEVAKRLGDKGTEEDVKARLNEMEPDLPEFPMLSWTPVEAHANSPEVTASLREVPKLLPRTTHSIARLALAVMTHIGLHFTAAGFTTRLVDNVQQPNIQAVSVMTPSHIYLH
jgi:hypothetical protein